MPGIDIFSHPQARLSTTSINTLLKFHHFRSRVQAFFSWLQWKTRPVEMDFSRWMLFFSLMALFPVTSGIPWPWQLLWNAWEVSQPHLGLPNGLDPLIWIQWTPRWFAMNKGGGPGRLVKLGDLLGDEKLPICFLGMIINHHKGSLMKQPVSHGICLRLRFFFMARLDGIGDCAKVSVGLKQDPFWCSSKPVLEAWKAEVWDFLWKAEV